MEVLVVVVVAVVDGIVVVVIVGAVVVGSGVVVFTVVVVVEVLLVVLVTGVVDGLSLGAACDYNGPGPTLDVVRVEIGRILFVREFCFSIVDTDLA